MKFYMNYRGIDKFNLAFFTVDFCSVEKQNALDGREKERKYLNVISIIQEG